MDRNKSHQQSSLHIHSMAEKPALNSERTEYRTAPCASWASGGFEHLRNLSPSASWNLLIPPDSRNDYGTPDKMYFSKNGINSNHDHDQASPDMNTGICVGKRKTPAAE
jgi:hypothetical protein